MEPPAGTQSLRKLILLALVGTRGAKLHYWKEFFTTLGARLRQAAGLQRSHRCSLPP